MPAPSLASLARAAGHGDREAFAQLVSATTPGVFALALRLVGNEHDASDVVQETYLRAYRAIGRFRGDAAVTTWLYRITANCAANHRAHRSRRGHSPLEDALAVAETRPERDPQAAVDSGIERAALKRAIAALPPSLRAAVVLRDVYDLPIEAIARELGISKAATKVRLHRGRRKLRELLFPSAEGSGTAGEATIEVLPSRAGEGHAAAV